MKVYLTSDADIKGCTILLKDLQSVVVDLHQGGWRYSDKAQLMCEYGFTDKQLKKVCCALLKLERKARRN